MVKHMSLGGIYTVTSLFCYLPAVWPRMGDGTIVWAYWEGGGGGGEGGEGDEVKFTSDACFLLVLLLPTPTGPSPL